MMQPAPVVSLWDTAPAPAAPAPLPAAAATFCHLRTGRGNFLAADGAEIGMAETPSADAIVALFPDANRQLVFLLAPDLRPLHVRGDGISAPAISAFRLQTENPEALRLRHPLVPQRFLGVTPVGAGAPNGCALFDSLGGGPLDLFSPMPLDQATLPPDVLRAAAEICAAVARPFRAEALLARLHALTLRPDLAEALIRVLPRDELADLAQRALDVPDDLLVLLQSMPDNPWFTRALPELAAWRARRAAPPGGVLHSPPADEFAGDPFEGFGQPQAGFALTALARATVRPTRGACLLTAMRNEGAYVLEWLAYHRSIGFEHAFIYTNDNFDGSDSLLEALAAQGEITLVYNQPGTHCGPQYKMHGHALSLLPQVLAYRWMALIDADEFIGFDPRRFRDIEDFLAWHETQPVDAIALCWQVFAAGADVSFRDAPTLARFTAREPSPNHHVKTIFRPAKFWYAHAHYPHATLGMPFIFRTESGALHHHPAMPDRNPAFAADPHTNLAWVNHYWLRSAPEMLWKMARGHPDWKGDTKLRHLEMAQRLCHRFVALMQRTDLVEDRRILACAAGVSAELQRLRALPGVAAAADRIHDDFLRRLAHMAQAFINTQAGPGDEPPEFAAFRDVLRGVPPPS
jgi:hypothetical protein